MSIFELFRKKDAGESQQATLARGLERSREGLFSRLSRAVAGKSRVDEEVLDQLEEILITADVGVDTTLRIIERIEARVAREKYLHADELNAILRDEVTALLAEAPSASSSSSDLGMLFERDASGNPFVLMVVGVNGVGKTTSIGKLAARLTAAGKRVYLGAADTFRAAAIDQLEVWAERAGARLVKQQMGADPASVAFDTLSAAKAAGADVAIIDTAGRLHNKVNLMNELTKIRNVMQKVVPGAPHEVLLVLDGSTGQNAFEQAKQFSAATQITSLAVTKLDGTAKGGVVIGISERFRIPVRYIGVGEGIDDLQVFDGARFVSSLFGDSVDSPGKS